MEVFGESRGGTVTAFAVRPDFGRQNAVMRSLLLRSLPAPPRATISGGTAVRPKDDTSNEGLSHRP